MFLLLHASGHIFRVDSAAGIHQHLQLPRSIRTRRYTAIDVDGSCSLVVVGDSEGDAWVIDEHSLSVIRCDRFPASLRMGLDVRCRAGSLGEKDLEKR